MLLMDLNFPFEVADAQDLTIGRSSKISRSTGNLRGRLRSRDCQAEGPNLSLFRTALLHVPKCCRPSLSGVGVPKVFNDFASPYDQLIIRLRSLTPRISRTLVWASLRVENLETSDNDRNLSSLSADRSGNNFSKNGHWSISPQQYSKWWI